MSTRTRSSARLQAQISEDNSEQPSSEREREREIWDELRDEHYDSKLPVDSASFLTLILPAQVIEQLPLTIHRQLTLLRQLDNQAHGAVSQLGNHLTELHLSLRILGRFASCYQTVHWTAPEGRGCETPNSGGKRSWESVTADPRASGR